MVFLLHIHIAKDEVIRRLNQVYYTFPLAGCGKFCCSESEPVFNPKTGRVDRVVI
jgi:hypothetical protein